MQGPNLDGALGRAQFGGEPGFAVLILGAMRHPPGDFEEPGPGPVGAGVELDAKQAYSIETNANRAFRVAGLETQHKTLSPLLRLGLGSTALTEIAVHVEIARIQIGLAVTEKFSRRRR
ncbi:hypothetical protein D9M71_381450 [compost metagenome]